MGVLGPGNLRSAETLERRFGEFGHSKNPRTLAGSSRLFCQTKRFDSSDLEADSIRFQVLTGAVRASPIRVRFLNWVSREFLSFLKKEKKPGWGGAGSGSEGF